MKLDLYAIYSTWLREMLRYVRLRSRLIGSIGAPFFFLAFLGIGFTTGGAGMSGLPQRCRLHQLSDKCLVLVQSPEK
jgi:ABC-2 type transport system permease protein